MGTGRGSSERKEIGGKQCFLVDLPTNVCYNARAWHHKSEGSTIETTDHNEIS